MVEIRIFRFFRPFYKYTNLLIDLKCVPRYVELRYCEYSVKHDPTNRHLVKSCHLFTIDCIGIIQHIIKKNQLAYLIRNKILYTREDRCTLIPNFYYNPRNELRRVKFFWPVSQSVCPSVRPSVQSFLSAQLLWNRLNRISWNFVVMKDVMCRCAYPQEILIPFFFSELRPFWT